MTNGQGIVTPRWWYPRLSKAMSEQRARYELSPFGVHWPEVDEDLSVEDMLRGAEAIGGKKPGPV